VKVTNATKKPIVFPAVEIGGGTVTRRLAVGEHEIPDVLWAALKGLPMVEKLVRMKHLVLADAEQPKETPSKSRSKDK
jgi:hypothetical protein